MRIPILAALAATTITAAAWADTAYIVVRDQSGRGISGAIVETAPTPAPPGSGEIAVPVRIPESRDGLVTFAITIPNQDPTADGKIDAADAVRCLQEAVGAR